MLFNGLGQRAGASATCLVGPAGNTIAAGSLAVMPTAPLMIVKQASLQAQTPEAGGKFMLTHRLHNLLSWFFHQQTESLPLRIIFFNSENVQVCSGVIPILLRGISVQCTYLDPAPYIANRLTASIAVCM